VPRHKPSEKLTSQLYAEGMAGNFAQRGDLNPGLWNYKWGSDHLATYRKPVHVALKSWNGQIAIKYQVKVHFRATFN